MQVKKFVGENTAQVMAMIRKEFGDDAIILQTNRVKTGGILGFFQKESIEILAALENESTFLKSTQQKIHPRMRRESDGEKGAFKHHMNSKETSIHLGNPIEKSMMLQKELGKKQIHSDIETIKVKNDLDEIKETVQNLSKKINETFKTPEEEENEKQEKEKIKKLTGLGISYELSKELITNIKKKGKKDTYDTMKEEIVSIFADYPRDTVNSTSKYTVFIGSTGVGKTTTLAKIASKMAIEEKKKVGFLTLDTYRISAVEQLKTYAEILSSPIEVAYEIQDLRLAVQRLSNRDIIFIDTAGRSHNNKGQIEDLKNVLSNMEDKKIYLILSANMNLSDIYDIIDVYSFIEEYDIIVTKMDETKRHGNLLDIMRRTGKSIAYTAFGQNVPDDIEPFVLNTYVGELIKEIYV